MAAARLALVALLAAGCSFQPAVPSGTVSCTSNADCPARQTCQVPTGEMGGRRLCCGPLGCVSPGPRRMDAAPLPPLGPPPLMYDAATVIVADAGAPPDDVAPPPPPPPAPDAGPPDLAPIDVSALVSCLRPIATVPTPNGRRSFCSLGLLDPLVVLDVDTLDNNNAATTVASAQECQARLDLAAKTTDPASKAPRPLPAADLEVLVAVLKHYRALCDQHMADEVIGAYAGGWARTVPNATEIQAAIKARVGLDLEILTPEQEVLQRYLGAARNRRGRLVVHARGAQVATAWWPNGAAAPTEVPVTLDVRAADAMFFSGAGVQSFQDARRRYTDALDDELGGRLNTWRQLMQQNRLDESLTADLGDAGVALAVNGTLRDGGDMWDDVDTFTRKVSGAPVNPQGDYGRGYGVLALRQLGQFVDSIDTPQFDQLRREPIKSAYGLRVMVLATFLEFVVRTPGLPIEEAGAVAVSPSHGYLFRKRLQPD